jgi:A/G-specific adenine glycosylase
MSFQNKLLAWYDSNARVLPWRENSDPYRIWLSEVMLQQTQVATVIAYFNRFISRFPSVEALGAADEETVLKLWEGLGYYSRARRLIPCAQMVVETYGGVFPKSYKEIIKLPGVGSYTAGAILSIAYNMKVPAVDGNVMRVYARLFNLDWDISLAKIKKEFEDLVMETLPEDRRHFNQGLMELGALICTPKSPKCDQCPIVENCLAYKAGSSSNLPIKSKKIKKKHMKKLVLAVACGGEILLVRRPSEGLLAGLWGLPTLDYQEPVKDSISYWLEDHLDLVYVDHEIVKEAKHIFTHLIWDMTLVRVNVHSKRVVDFPEVVWVDPNGVSDYPLPTAYKKLLTTSKTEA